MFKRLSRIFLIFLLILSFAVSSASAADGDGDHLVVYAADSLKGAMQTYIPLYNRLTNHKDDFVILCCTGSNSLVNDITNNGATPDVIFSADYSLIDDRLMPKYTLWNAEFARNSIVIAYRKNSTNASNINGDNWYKVLNDSNVHFGFGNPNKDPCGYRSVMAIALANNYAAYSNPNIFNDLIAANSKIYATKNGTGYDIYSPTNIEAVDYKIIVDPDAAGSLERLKDGKIDFAFVYKNQAEEAKYNDSSIDYVTLPNELSLNDTKYEEEYSHIRLFENYDNSSAMKIITLTPIVYGFTQLSVGKSSDAAQKFLDIFCELTAYENPEDSSAILKYMDHILPLMPSSKTNWYDIPDWMQRYMDKSIDNENSITINPNNGTIQESVDKLPSGGTLYLDPGTYSQPGDYNIEISKDINIKAVNKQVTIDGNKTNQIFNVNKGSALNIERLNLVNGYSNINGFGGAIFNYGECGIIECNLVNNTASNCGGAITNTGICNIVDSNLTNNTAHNGGGAIHDYGINSRLTVNNSIFIENICYDTDFGRGSGGAISSTLDGILKLNNNDFTKGNNATLGPSLSIWGGSTCTVDSCKFNKRSDLQSVDATINTVNCIFLEDNSDNLCFTTNVNYSRGSNLFSESFR